MRSERDEREVGTTGLGGLSVDQGSVYTIRLSAELPQSPGERAVAIFRIKGFCLFVSPLAKIENTRKAAGWATGNGREANGLYWRNIKF